MEKTTKTLTPAEIAARAVDAFFSNAATALYHLTSDREELSEALERGAEEVLEVLKAGFVARHGSIEANTDEAINREMLGMEAGYLVGVQVGLRMRNIGDVR